MKNKAVLNTRPPLIGPRKWLIAFALAVAVWQIIPIFLMSYERAFYKSHFPDYFNSWPNNGSFSMIDNFTAQEDTYQYMARGRDAGLHTLPGDPYIKGNRSAAIVSRDFLSFYVFGWIFRLTQDIHTAYTLSCFFFSILWVLLIYAVMLKTGVKHGVALFIAVITTLFADLLGQFNFGDLFRPRETFKLLVQYLFWPLGSYHYFFGPTRMIRPLFTVPCLFLAGLAWIQSDKKQSWLWSLSSGLAGGALAYVHLDVWAAYVGAAGLFVAQAFRKRRFPVKAAASLMITLLASLPAFLLVAAIKKSSIGTGGTGVEYGRNFCIAAIPFLAGAWIAYRKFKEEAMTLWIACSLAAAFAISNAQFVTGWTLSTSHATTIGNYFLLFLAGRWIEGRARWPGSAWIWLSATALLLALPRLISFSSLHYKIYALPQAEEEAFRWLDRNSPRDAVVAALSATTYMKIPVNTHNKTLVSFIVPIISDIPAMENAQRIIHALSLFGVSLADYVREGEDQSGQYGRKLWQGIVDQDSRDRSEAFRAHFWFKPASDVVELLRTAARDPGAADYEVEYLWVGPYEKQLMSGPLPNPARWKKVFENASITLFQSGTFNDRSPAVPSKAARP